MNHLHHRQTDVNQIIEPTDYFNNLNNLVPPTVPYYFCPVNSSVPRINVLNGKKG